MRIRFALVFAIGALALCAGQIRADEWDTPIPDTDGSIALAEQFASSAHQALRSGPKSAPAWGESAALYRAALRLNPAEPRFARALADTCLHQGDAAGAMEALQIFKKLKPENQVAQVQIIDLYLAEMQSADNKLKYLHQIQNKHAIAPEIRSEAAVRIAKLLVGKSQIPEAIKSLDAALVLNKLNLGAMRMKFQLTRTPDASLVNVMQLLNMMQAAPGDPVLISALAQQLAQLGLVEQSISWFSLADNMFRQTGTQPDAQFVKGAASELFISNRPDIASKFLDTYLAVVPEDIDSWFSRLVITKSQLLLSKDDKDLQQTMAAEQRYAQIALVNRLQEIRASLGDSTATTRPINSDADSPVPDLSNDAVLLQKGGSPQVAQQYLTVATALAWFDLYFRHDAAAADPVLDVMGKLLNDRDIQLARLRGWRQYIAGDLAGATTKLSAVADQDPLAALGLILININSPATHDQAIAQGKQLLSRIPFGPVGAMIFGELHPFEIKPEPQPQAIPVATEMDNFNKDILAFNTQPSAFYVIRAEPVKATYEFGEPVLVRVTLENVSRQDLAIGRECALHPDLWFDAHLRGMVEKNVPAAAFDQIGERLVLGAGQSISNVTRVDADELYTVFNQRPDLAFTLNMTVTTNPVATDSTQARPGPGGMAIDLLRMAQRNPSPVNSQEAINKLTSRLQQGDGGERIRVLQVMSVYEALMRSQTNGQPMPPPMKSLSDGFLAIIHRMTADTSQPVRSYGKYLSTLTGDDALLGVNQMARDVDWQTRLLALRVAPILKGKANDVVVTLARDKDPIVAAYATALWQSQEQARPTTDSATPSGAEAPGAASNSAPAGGAPVTMPSTMPSSAPDSTPATQPMQ
ncbi:MAG: hypothetical protein M3O30_07230 [Planctomycetota bacterium]|nr:hypothetical protein [Planctomycetota bacterium]